MTVQSGGVVTHSAYPTNGGAGLHLSVTGTLDVQAGGVIDVNSRGLRGAGNGSVFGSSGEAYDASGTSIVSGSSFNTSWGNGGAYGGAAAPMQGGGVVNAVYGIVEDPHHLGSGGGSPSGAAGNGGGRIDITAGTLTLNGTVRANGGAGSGRGGGGAGGAIKIATGSLTGAGSIQSFGGDAPAAFVTPGAGGRIAIRYDTSSFPEANLGTHAGSATSDKSSGGTIYLKDNAQANGDLIIDNGGLIATVETPLRTSVETFRSVRVRNQGRLIVDTAGLTLHGVQVSGGLFAATASLTFADGNDFVLSATGTMEVRTPAIFTIAFFNATNIQAGTVIIDSGGRMDVTSGSVTVGSGATLVKDGAFGAADQIGSVTVQSGGVVTHSGYPTNTGAGLHLSVTGTLDVQTGGLIDVNAKGLRGASNGSVFGASGEAYDASGSSVVSGSSFNSSWGNGGAYGGAAAPMQGGGVVNAVYGIVEDPHHLGSGGGSPSGTGGNGGGRIDITAGTLSVNGIVRANGGAGSGRGGGGSGGAIKIVSGSVTGTGAIQAFGGDAPASFVTPGAGGRIAIRYDTLSLPETNLGTQAGAGTSDRSSGGTIYLKDNAQASGDLIIDNGSLIATVETPLRTSLTTFRHFKVRAGGRLEVASLVEPHLNVADLLVDGAGSLLTTASRDLSGMRVSVATSFTLSNGGRIDAAGDGLLGGRAEGNAVGNAGEAFAADGVTAVSGSTGGSAGSYGGLGGGSTPNATYGINVNPKQAGSGGSVSTAAGNGGSGGGRLWIDAATCSIPTGTSIVSDGGAAVSGSGAQGGGSGGAIKLDCPTISGGGSITAKGGAGSGTNGHGGGGGRVVLRTNINNFTGPTTAPVATAGGAATGAGQVGQAGTFLVLDLVAPRVAAMSPAPGATIIGDLQQVQVTFTENLYAPGLTNNHVLLTGAASGAHVPMSLSFNTGNQTLTITYAASLPQDTYTLTLISGEELDGLSDSSLNALDGEYAGSLPSGNGASGGSFVAAFGVNTAPRVVEVVPGANALSVPEASNVTVRFSEPIDPATVTTASFRLLANGTPVPATVNVSTSGTRATLDPTPVLSLDTLYTVEVSSSVTDVTGVAAVPFTSLFRTSTTPTGSKTLPSVSDQATGLAAQSRTGAAVAGAGDLNGDQVNDWIAGAPSYQAPTGFSAGPVEAGAALVYLGGTSATERTAPDIVFTGVSAHDRAGVSVASNFDFNGDGINDIVIGAEQVNRTPDDDPVAGCNAGAPCGPGKVYLIYFDPSDSVHYPNFGNPAVPDVVSLSLVAQPGGIPGVVFTGVALGDQAGFSVAGGGTSTPGGGRDIVIGAPGADPGARTDAGAAYVVFDNNALSGNISLTRISDGLPDQVPGKAYLGAAAGDNLGYSTAFGGDVVQGQTLGTGSVLMGAPSAASHRGVSICPPGDPDTTPIIVDAVGTTHSGFQIRGTQDGEQVGYSVASGGDAFADGVPDLLIGAPTYDVDIRTDAGRTLETTQVIASGVYDADAVGTTLNGATWTGSSSGDELGYAVAGVHDVTGDGYDDVVLGAPFVDPIIGGVPQADAGAVYLIGGAPATGHLGTFSASNVGTTIAGESLTGTQPGEHAGSSIAGTGDIDGTAMETSSSGRRTRTSSPIRMPGRSIWSRKPSYLRPEAAGPVAARCRIFSPVRRSRWGRALLRRPSISRRPGSSAPARCRDRFPPGSCSWGRPSSIPRGRASHLRLRRSTSRRSPRSKRS
jgi:hypothetical protein